MVGVLPVMFCSFGLLFVFACTAKLRACLGCGTEATAYCFRRTAMRRRRSHQLVGAIASAPAGDGLVEDGIATVADDGAFSTRVAAPDLASMTRRVVGAGAGLAFGR